jgi:hypothetical protein
MQIQQVGACGDRRSSQIETRVVGDDRYPPPCGSERLCDCAAACLDVDADRLMRVPRCGIEHLARAGSRWQADDRLGFEIGKVDGVREWR